MRRKARLPGKDFAACPGQRNDMPTFRPADMLRMQVAAVFCFGQSGQAWSKNRTVFYEHLPL